MIGEQSSSDCCTKISRIDMPGNWLCQLFLFLSLPNEFKWTAGVVQDDQPRITRNALKGQILDLFTKLSSGHN